jgi:hypothetical protein
MHGFPQSNGPSYYECSSHFKRGRKACPTPRIPSRYLDRRALLIFRDWHLDFEGSRDRVLARVDGHLADSEKATASAERELLDLVNRRKRLDRAFDDGEIGGDLYQRRSDEYDAEEQGARAEHERLSAHLALLREAGDGLDDAAFAQRFRALGEALGSELRDAASRPSLAALADGKAAEQAQVLDDYKALRAAFTSLFCEATVTVNEEPDVGYIFDPDRAVTLDTAGMPDGRSERIDWLRENGALREEKMMVPVVELDLKLDRNALALADIDEQGMAKVPLHLGAGTPPSEIKHSAPRW